MNCQELAACIERMEPTAQPRDVARLCLLLTNFVDDLSALSSDDRLTEVWQEIGMRLQAATDQHAAMTADLEHLASLHPAQFATNEIWTLVRAIKVQSQVLQLYVGNAFIAG